MKKTFFIVFILLFTTIFNYCRLPENNVCLVPTQFVMAKGGTSHSIILGKDGTVWATGDNSSGQLGKVEIGSGTANFTKVASDVKMIATGNNHSLILKNDGTVWATGYNTNGQLGTGQSGSGTNKNTFTKVASDVKMIVAGGNHSLILKNDGTVWATGYNYYGQLGTGDNTNRNTFTKVASDVKMIAGGGSHSLILKTDGTVWATGDNTSGQLGTGESGSGTNKTTFTKINKELFKCK